MITLFICNCCGKIAQTQEQPALISNRAPLIQIECVQPGCANHMWTYTYRAGDDNTQALDRYTPVTMDDQQAARFIAAHAVQE